MRQPWIHNAKSDFWWILSPPFIGKNGQNDHHISV